MMREHVFLVGFMGSGKSTVGALLGPSLSLPFVDLDEQISKVEGRTISQIFESDGEAYFRRVEARVLAEVVSSNPAVVSLGGGAFVASANRRKVRSAGISIWLSVSLDEARRRCRREGGRPLARDPREFERLYTRRLAVYRKCDLAIETDGKTPRAVAREITLRLKERDDALD